MSCVNLRMILSHLRQQKNIFYLYRQLNGTTTSTRNSIHTGEPVCSRRSFFCWRNDRCFPAKRPFEIRKTTRCNISDVACGIAENGLFITVEWPDGIQARFHGVWLRINCHCSLCRDASSNQRLMDPFVIEEDIPVTHCRLSETDNNLLYLSWGQDDHEGFIPLDYLKEFRYEDEVLDQWHKSANPKLEILGSVPELQYKDFISSDDVRYRWIRTISDVGLCLLRNVPTDKGYIKKVAEEIAHIKPTMYGEVFDVMSMPDPINVAYTCHSLPYHMDLMYYEGSPGIQMLHCLRFDQDIDGGVLELVDMFHVVEELRRNHPMEFDILTKIPCLFERILRGRKDTHYMVNHRPHISLNSNGEVVAVRWNPFTEYGHGIKHTNFIPYFKAYKIFGNLIKSSPTKMSLRLVPGDLIAFNNRRVAHRRTEIFLKGDNSVRHFQGCYVDIDDFQSKVHVMAKSQGDDEPVSRCGNSSYL